MIACDQLVANLQPVYDQLGSGAAWVDVVQTAYDQGIDLSARHM